MEFGLSKIVLLLIEIVI